MLLRQPVRDGGQPVRLWQGCALVVGDRDQRVVAPPGVGFRQILEVEAAVQRGDGLRCDLLEEWKMHQVDVEVQDVELVASLVQLVQHREMGREIGLERGGIEPDGLVSHRHERGFGLRFGTGKQRHLVAEFDQGVGEMGDDPFGAAVKAGRDGLVERCDLGNPHRTPSTVVTS